MEPGAPSLIPIGIWLVPLVVIAAIGGLYLLARYWRNQAQQDLKELRAELRRFQAWRRQIAVDIQGYSPQDGEPFGSRIARLLAQLQEIDQQLASLELQNVAIRERIGALAANRWRAIVGSPFYWYLLHQDISGLGKNRLSIQNALNTAGESQKALTGIAWEVAQQAREVRTLGQKVSRLMEQLRAKNIHGNMLEAATLQEDQAKSILSQIPSLFLKASETDVRQQADKLSTIQTYERLVNTRPILERLLAQAQEWEAQYARAVNSVANLRQTLVSLDQMLANMSKGLLLAPQKTRADQLTVISENLHATLARLEIESVGSVTEEAARVQTAAQELETQLKQARQQSAALEQVLSELNEGIKKLSAQFALLGTGPVHPIIWDQSSARLTQLSRQASTIGQASKSRTLEQAAQDLEAAVKLNAQQKELAGYCAQVSQQHTDLLAILSSPEFVQAKDWSQNTQKLTQAVALYDPENWPRPDKISSLAEELRALEEGLQILNGSSPAEPIPEAEIAQRLADAHEMALFFQKLRERVENIQSRLVDLQQTEKAAQDQIERARPILSQLNSLVRSNPYLNDFAAQEINRLQASLQQLNADISQRQQGKVEKKTKDASALVGKIEQTANNWLDLLNQNLEGETRKLARTLSSLDMVAPLEEPVVVEARRLLSSGQPSLVGSGQKSRLRLEDTLPELKRRSDYWQACTAANRAIGDLEKHILESYTAAKESRQSVKDLFSNASIRTHGPRGWPPTSSDLETERQELEKIEAQWEALKQQQAKAISLVSQLGNLSSKYQSLAEKTRRASENISREQSQVQTLENELDEYTRLWQNQRQVYQDTPTTVEDIQQLLEGIRHEKEAIKGQYRQGAKDYNQVLQSLKSLHRKARLQQIPIDETHVIDVNGRIIAFR